MHRSIEGVHLSDDQRLDWLRLIRSDNVGPRTFRALVNHYGGAHRALTALPDLARRGGASGPARVCSRQEAERELAAARSLGVALVALGEPDYPRRLMMIDDAPPLLAVRGSPAVFGLPIVAIVGARNASAAGTFRAPARADLGDAGFAVVSGLARGIDSAAHAASLASGTIVVLAGGQITSTRTNTPPLAATSWPKAALITEMPLGWEPRARDFPRRNRLISGLAVGIVVVEAARRSGSLITARFALEQGREVFAVPGSPLDPRAEGTNDLLKQGATLVTEAADVITVVRPILGEPVEAAVAEPDASPLPALEPGGGERARIVDLLGPTPVPIDDLIRLSGVRRPPCTWFCSSSNWRDGSSATAARWFRSFIGPPEDCCRPDRDRGARLNVRVYSDWPGRQPTIGSNRHGQSGERRKSSANGHHQRRSRHGSQILARH